MQYFNWCGERGTWCGKHAEDVLIKLKLSWHVHSNVALLLQSQVLCFIQEAERIGHDFEFIAKSSFVNVAIAGQEVSGLAVLNQNGVVCSHWLALHLKSCIGVNCFYDPGCVI